jgi:hypothetical protein
MPAKVIRVPSHVLDGIPSSPTALRWALCRAVATESVGEGGRVDKGRRSIGPPGSPVDSGRRNIGSLARHRTTRCASSSRGKNTFSVWRRHLKRKSHERADWRTSRSRRAGKISDPQARKTAPRAIPRRSRCSSPNSLTSRKRARSWSTGSSRSGSRPDTAPLGRRNRRQRAVSQLRTTRASQGVLTRFRLVFKQFKRLRMRRPSSGFRA